MVKRIKKFLNGLDKFVKFLFLLQDMRHFLKHKSEQFEKNSTEDMTIPDQSLSVRDILRNYTRDGLSLPSAESGDDDDFETPLNNYEDLVDAKEDIEYYTHTVNVNRKKKTEAPRGDSADLKESNVAPDLERSATE